MNIQALLGGLRFIDSFFPSGGYAFSSGLEAAVQGGLVKNRDDLASYVEETVTMGIGQRETVAVCLAHQAFASGALQAVLRVDLELDAMKLGREGRLASRQMGRQVIRIAAETSDAALLDEYRAAVDVGVAPGHLAAALGVTLAAMGWSRETAAAAFLYQHATAALASAMKLLPIGQREAQRLLKSWLPLIEQVSRRAVSQQVMYAWSPLQDIYAMRHAELESRLFRS
jgi:urease accessory protein